jgi:fumarate hydratase class I
MIRLTTPISEARIRSLQVGDEVRLYGRVVLSRDLGHKFMIEHRPEWLKPILEGALVYHCGPVVRKHPDGRWSFVSAGPTTSIREEPYQAAVLEQYRVRGVIGKGGMGRRTSDALAAVGACYFHATGGAGALLAGRVKRVVEVRMLEEFGTPEAFWVVEVEDLPLVVTMDSHGGSLHEEVLARSRQVAERLLDGGPARS